MPKFEIVISAKFGEGTQRQKAFYKAEARSRQKATADAREEAKVLFPSNNGWHTQVVDRCIEVPE